MAAAAHGGQLVGERLWLAPLKMMSWLQTWQPCMHRLHPVAGTTWQPGANSTASLLAETLVQSKHSIISAEEAGWGPALTKF